MISFQQAIKSITKNDLAPVYLLLGAEYYFVDQFRTTFIKKIGDESEGINNYDLRDTAIQDVIIDLETLPFFTERNISFAENPVFLRGGNEKIAVTHDIKRLEQYIENPAPYSTLIIIAPYENIDKRKKITKLLLKHAVVIDCNPIKGRDLRKWLNEMLSMQHVQMSEEAKSIVEAEFGPNLFLLQKEIEKIAQYVGENRQINETELLDIMSSSVEQTAIELADAVLKSDLTKAITIYKQLEKMNEDPIGMIALLSFQFRTILQVKLLSNRGYPLPKIQSVMRAHPFAIKKAYERIRRFDEKTLNYIINELAETDYYIKRGIMQKEIAFELLIYRLINKAQKQQK